MNVFITGINQIEDVEIDRLNKPWLPIAAGDLSLEAARRIVAVAAIAPDARWRSPRASRRRVAVGVALAIGWAYSCPPLRLKRYPALAAGSITFVRSLVVNLGVWLHIAGTPVSAGVWALIAVTVPVLLRHRGAQGRARHRGRPALRDRHLLGAARAAARCWPSASARSRSAGSGWRSRGRCCSTTPTRPCSWPATLLGLAALWRWALRVDPSDPIAFAGFYQRVWQLFFCEYLLVPLAYVVG